MKPAILFLTLFSTAGTVMAATTITPPSTTRESVPSEAIAKVEDTDNTPFGKAVRACESGDFNSALPVLEELSKQGDVRAIHALGRLHRAGMGVQKSAEKAQAFFERAADKGHPASLLDLATMVEVNDPGMALALYRQAAEAGQSLAELKLGYCYETGQLGVPINPKLAFNLYTKAADAGIAEASFALARCFDKGIGTSPDALKATRLCREAAIGGVVKAQLDMAVRYFEGNGVEEDPVAASGWLTVASQSGSMDAQLLLGTRYENGDAVIQDYDQAGRYYAMASAQGSLVAKHRLAMFYRDGRGTAKDPVRAYVLLSQAKGYAPADEDLMKLVGTMEEAQFQAAQAKLAEIKKAAEPVSE